jgi:hypothetical protein
MGHSERLLWRTLSRLAAIHLVPQGTFSPRGPSLAWRRFTLCPRAPSLAAQFTLCPRAPSLAAQFTLCPRAPSLAAQFTLSRLGAACRQWNTWMPGYRKLIISTWIIRGITAHFQSKDRYAVMFVLEKLIKQAKLDHAIMVQCYRL